MKTIKIIVRIKSGKLATAIETEGYDRTNISSQLELLGIMENTKNIINERIKKLVNLEN